MTPPFPTVENTMTESNVTAKRLREIADFAERTGAEEVMVPVSAITLALEALALRTPSDGVRVKPLEWEEDEPGWWCAQPAAMIGGFGYEVRITDSGKVRARRGRDDWADFNGTLVEAKSAAQADYEQRILSTLAGKE